VSNETVLIIGAGQAAAQTAASLRQGGFDGGITIERPPLSKAYLKGDLEQERLYFKNAEWYTAQNIEVLTQTTVTSVDVKANIAQTNKGQTLSFDHLVFATGTSPY